MIGMQNKKFFSILTGAYGLAPHDKLLQIGAFRGTFVSAYFLYEKMFEDPFLNLVQRQQGLFQKGDILDLGDNIGYTSTVFVGALQPHSKVYVFEPDRQTYSLPAAGS